MRHGPADVLKAKIRDGMPPVEAHAAYERMKRSFCHLSDTCVMDQATCPFYADCLDAVRRKHDDRFLLVYQGRAQEVPEALLDDEPALLGLIRAFRDGWASEQPKEEDKALSSGNPPAAAGLGTSRPDRGAGSAGGGRK